MGNNEKFPEGEKNTEDLKENTVETRKKIINDLKRALESNKKVKAVFIVGADAQKRGDQYSDVDFDIVLDPDSVEDVEKMVKESLAKFAPIKNELKRKMSKGDLQVIYQFSKTSKFLHVDVIYFTSFDHFDDDESEMEILFDKDNVIKKREKSEEDTTEIIKNRIESIGRNEELRQSYIEKELKRGNLQAIEKYQGLILPILIETLRLLYCPERSEYYLKNIEKDLPEKVVKEVEKLLFFTSLEDLEKKYEKANKLLHKTLDELKSKI